MTVEELIEILKNYPPEVQVIIMINTDIGQIALRVEESINNVYPYVYNHARAVCICYQKEECEE